MNNHAVQFILEFSSVLKSIFTNSVYTDEQVARQTVTFTIIKSNYISKVIVLKIFLINIQNVVIIYENIRYRVIASQDHSVAIVNVKAGKDTDKVRLIPEKETSALVPASVTPASVMFEIIEESVPDKITAPVKAGEILGQAKVYYAGIELTTVNLVAAQNVDRSFIGLIMSKISDLVGSTFFMLLTIVLFLAAASYLAIIMSKFYGWDKKFAKAMAEKKKATSNKTPAKKKAAPAKPAAKKPAPKNNIKK